MPNIKLDEGEVQQIRRKLEEIHRNLNKIEFGAKIPDSKHSFEQTATYLQSLINDTGKIEDYFINNPGSSYKPSYILIIEKFGEKFKFEISESSIKSIILPKTDNQKEMLSIRDYSLIGIIVALDLIKKPIEKVEPYKPIEPIEPTITTTLPFFHLFDHFFELIRLNTYFEEIHELKRIRRSNKDNLILGRQELDINNTTISRKQAEFELNPDNEWTILDLSTQRSTMILVSRPIAIKSGITIIFPDHKIKVEFLDTNNDSNVYKNLNSKDNQITVYYLNENGEINNEKRINIYEGDEIIFNRSMLNSKNVLINEICHFKIKKETDRLWYISNPSQVKRLFIKISDKFCLKNGDILLMGDKLFKFECTI